jgi:catechol 2,3-dioxygenase-like lactoylglutathione lyase family enzyme
MGQHRSGEVEMSAPTVLRLDHWTKLTNDMDRCRWFYGEVLGANLRHGPGPEGAELGGIIIDFFPARDGRAPEPGTNGQHHAYEIRFDDYDAWVQRFESNGITVRRASHGPNIITMYVEDPDGFHLEFFANIDDPERGREEITRRGIRLREDD